MQSIINRVAAMVNKQLHPVQSRCSRWPEWMAFNGPLECAQVIDLENGVNRSCLQRYALPCQLSQHDEYI